MLEKQKREALLTKYEKRATELLSSFEGIDAPIRMSKPVAVVLDAATIVADGIAGSSHRDPVADYILRAAVRDGLVEEIDADYHIAVLEAAAILGGVGNVLAESVEHGLRRVVRERGAAAVMVVAYGGATIRGLGGRRLGGTATLSSGHHPVAIIDKIVALRVRMRRLGVSFAPAPKSVAKLGPRPYDDQLAAAAVLLGPQLVVHEVSDDVMETLTTDASEPECPPRLLDRSCLTLHREGPKYVVTAVLPIDDPEWLDVVHERHGRLGETIDEAKQAIGKGRMWLVATWVGAGGAWSESVVATSDWTCAALKTAVQLGALYDARKVETTDDNKRTSAPTQRAGKFVEPGAIGWTVRRVSIKKLLGLDEPAPPTEGPTKTIEAPATTVGASSSEPRAREGIETEISVAEHYRWQVCGKGRSDRKWRPVRSHRRTVLVKPNVRVRVTA